VVLSIVLEEGLFAQPNVDEAMTRMKVTVNNLFKRIGSKSLVDAGVSVLESA
jgi:hypothetical protein